MLVPEDATWCDGLAGWQPIRATPDVDLRATDARDPDPHQDIVVATERRLIAHLDGDAG
jgi:hypothetical protein